MYTLYKISILFFVVSFLGSCGSPRLENIGIVLDEPKDPQFVPKQDWDELKNKLYVSWGNTNTRYLKEYIPNIEITTQNHTSAWKQERVNAQVVLWSKDTVKNISIEFTDLQSLNHTIDASALKYYFIRNVLADEYGGGCGFKEKSDSTAHLVPDCLEDIHTLSIRGKSTRGIWINFEIPKTAKSGLYICELSIFANGKKIETLEMNINVSDNILPDLENWSFHLDLWQNPFAVARFHNVPLWSDKHFDLMRPLYKMLADAGQKCITATILNKPWGGQTYDQFGSMIKSTLKQNGEWRYNYSVFDKWVTFMMELGIKEKINCYSLIPWGNQLSYFDEKLEKDISLTAVPSSKEFVDYWIPFLIDFKTHLKHKGWYELCSIAMDERSMDDMKSAIKLIKEYSGLSITSAANYNPGISNAIFDLSVDFEYHMADSLISERKRNGQITTFYTCCATDMPNNFTFSAPIEGVWQAWYAYAQNYDGFLRWAYNSWVEKPLHDSRFRTWPSGDTYLVYPGAKSSIRFEKLREGIQDFEKIRILKQKLILSNNEKDKNTLNKLNTLMYKFSEPSSDIKMQELIIKGKELLNQ